MIITTPQYIKWLAARARALGGVLAAFVINFPSIVIYTGIYIYIYIYIYIVVCRKAILYNTEE